MKSVLSEREAEKSKALMTYHEVSAKTGPDGQRFFEIARKHEVYFKVTPKTMGEEDQGELRVKGTQSMAGLVPFTSLAKLQHCKVVWSVKWSMIGLVPVRPHLCLLGEMTLPSQKAVKL